MEFTLDRVTAFTADVASRVTIVEPSTTIANVLNRP